MTTASIDSIYHKVLADIQDNELQLPTLPEIAMKVRTAIAETSTTAESLSAIITKDPGLSAYLLKAASSPIYRRAIPPKSLIEVIGLLGFSAVNSLVMLHSTHNMVELTNARSKQLFAHTWERLVFKTSIASFLAKHLKFTPIDYVQMALILTEVGSLAVLSTMLNTSETPDTDTYFAMCRQYSKTVGCAILRKWEVNPSIPDMLEKCGHWGLNDEADDENIQIIDIANLALYNTILMTQDNPNLPELSELLAYKKIPKALQGLSKPNWLSLITENEEEIQSIISSLR